MLSKTQSLLWRRESKKIITKKGNKFLLKRDAQIIKPWENTGSSVGKESACNTGDEDSITGSGRSLKEGMATHSSILAWRIPMGRGAWRATVSGVAKNPTRLSD